MSDKYIEVTDSTFANSVLKSDKPVIVDFWAPWCGPCRAMAPTFEQLAGEYKDRMVFAKLNTDDNMNAPAQYGIQGIPTLIIFSNGKPVDSIVGLAPRETLKRRIDAALGAIA